MEKDERIPRERDGIRDGAGMLLVVLPSFSPRGASFDALSMGLTLCSAGYQTSDHCVRTDRLAGRPSGLDRGEAAVLDR